MGNFDVQRLAQGKDGKGRKREVNEGDGNCFADKIKLDLVFKT